MTTIPDTPTLREVLDRGVDPTDVVPLEELADVMLEIGLTLLAGGDAVRAGVAALTDFAFEPPEDPAEWTATLWAIEMLENPELMTRLTCSTAEMYVAVVAGLRRFGLGGVDDE